jgi:hypothetical protein
MRALAVPLLLALTVTAAPAVAQTRDPAAAESLFRGAKAAEERGDFKAACGLFAESERLDPAAGTLLNQADCEEHLGALATAWGHFLQAKDQLSPGDDRIAYATQRIAALDKRLPHLSIHLPPNAPPGTVVMRGQVEVHTAALGVPVAVDPGPLALTATVPGHAPVATSVTLAEGEMKDVTLKLDAPTATLPGAEGPSTSPTGDGAGTRRTLAWVAGGVGVAGLGVGVVTGILALGDASTFKNNCSQTTGACQNQTGVDAASSGKTASAVSTAGFIGGGVLVAAGVVLYLTTRSPTSPTVGAMLLPGGCAASVAGRF